MGEDEIGLDGWPVDPNHACYRMSDDEWRARIIGQNLRRYRLGVQAGRREAIGDALAFCAECGVPIPRWLERARKQRATPKRGRGQPPADETDFERYDMVRECRDRQGEMGIPVTWEQTWWVVSAALRRTPHWGTPETIRVSYKRVIKRMRATPGRYYLKDN